MADQYVAEIRIFPFNFAPQGWALCNGQILAISQNTALFSLLGTYYGGNGTSNFALPNFQGRAGINQGQGAGLSPYNLGQSGGNSTVTLLISQLAAHNHIPMATTTPTSNSPSGLTWSGPTGRPAPDAFANDPNASATMSPIALAATGGNGAHNNLMPYLTLNFCIALQGIYPPRS